MPLHSFEMDLVSSGSEWQNSRLWKCMAEMPLLSSLCHRSRLMWLPGFAVLTIKNYVNGLQNWGHWRRFALVLVICFQFSCHFPHSRRIRRKWFIGNSTHPACCWDAKTTLNVSVRRKFWERKWQHWNKTTIEKVYWNARVPSKVIK